MIDQSEKEIDQEIFERKVKNTTDMARIGIYIAAIMIFIGTMPYSDFIQETYSLSGVEYNLVAFVAPILALAVVAGVIMSITHYRVKRLKKQFNGNGGGC